MGLVLVKKVVVVDSLVTVHCKSGVWGSKPVQALCTLPQREEKNVVLGTQTHHSQ